MMDKKLLQLIRDVGSPEGLPLSLSEKLAKAIHEAQRKELDLLKLELSFAEGGKGSELAFRQAVIEGKKLKIQALEQEIREDYIKREEIQPVLDVLIKEMQELISLCENCGDFSNGVEFAGADEGIVNATQVINNARQAIKTVAERLPTKEG